MNKTKEVTKRWKFSDLHDLELMKATFVDHKFAKHYHDTYVIELVEDGIDEFYCEGKNYSANKGEVIIINPYEVHTGSPAENQPLKYISLYPSINLVKEALESLEIHFDEIPLFCDHVVNSKICANLINQIHKSLTYNNDLLAAQTYFHELIIEIISKYEYKRLKTIKYQNETHAVNKVRDFIHENSTENFSLNKLSMISGMNSYHMLRMFKKKFGLPPHKYLTNLRIKNACEKLAYDNSISNVALSLGFYDQSHFSRHFKNIVGLSPSQYSNEVNIVQDKTHQ